jgi:hypothetical protein
MALQAATLAAAHMSNQYRVAWLGLATTGTVSAGSE